MATVVTDSADTQEGPRAEGAPSPTLAERYRAVRAHSERLCETLETEDYVVSSMPDVSPTKWHLAHTSWFFETFVLAPNDPFYKPLDPKYAFLFNSYYVQAGERHCRAQRGLVTRPTVQEVFAYRRYVDDHMLSLLDRLEHTDVVTLGLHHEQQHQELMLTDIKHVFWMNPMRPAYLKNSGHGISDMGNGSSPDSPVPPISHLPSPMSAVPEGVYQIGHTDPSFAFDNETPAHRVFIEPFSIARDLVSNREYLAFVDDHGYHRPELWLAAGWALVREQKREAPLYWERTPDGWTEFTLEGTRPLDLDAPVCHVSYFEADAFARWAGKRLPTEAEWEVAARTVPDLARLYGDRWQWTQSAYVAYPGYKPAAGAIGEYNGKWMSDQWVLRGSSLATPPGHSRVTYRNFFPSDTRWQYSGIRLASS
ncbi:MAG TPA: ergothioneine biosynthesis protein EgtB [Gemmatimonadaceae bacterium]|nr:ergothioneine biosynthesis protein EgtB [Gemmatimonadaceae bacterium]